MGCDFGLSPYTRNIVFAVVASNSRPSRLRQLVKPRVMTVTSGLQYPSRTSNAKK